MYRFDLPGLDYEFADHELGLGCVLLVDHRRRWRDGDREIWIGHQAASPTFTVFTGRPFVPAAALIQPLVGRLLLHLADLL